MKGREYILMKSDNITAELVLSVVDPGFSRRGWAGQPTPEFRVETYYLTRFLPKTACK